MYLLLYCLIILNYGIIVNWNGFGFCWRLDMYVNLVRDRDWIYFVILVVICRYRFFGYIKIIILRIWLIFFRSWFFRIFRLFFIIVFMLVIFLWIVEKFFLYLRFRRVNFFFCVVVICLRRVIILFFKCWIKNLIKLFFEYRLFLIF